MNERDEKTVNRIVQLNAMNSRERYWYRTKSLSSFYAPNDSDPETETFQMSRASSIADFSLDMKSMPIISQSILAGDGELRKSFKKKIRKLAKREKKGTSVCDVSGIKIEEPRGDFMRTLRKKRTRSLSQLVESTIDGDGAVSNCIKPMDSKKQNLKAARMKLLVTRAAIDFQPKLVERTVDCKHSNSQRKHCDSPGVYSLHASEAVNDKNSSNPLTDDKMKKLITKYRNSLTLTQHLLYSKKYDSKWKGRYMDMFQHGFSGKKEKKPENRQGWVLPLKKIADKAGVSSRFFTENPAITLSEARTQVFLNRLSGPQQPNRWLAASDFKAISNSSLILYMTTRFDPRAMQARILMYEKSVLFDKDHVKVAGKFYNNIQLGKRMFGPSKKQQVDSSIIGGMERRFEILDNQVNHMPFDHTAFDQNMDKCRNEYIQCRDSTRVVLNFKTQVEQTDFIHANWVEGGPLFNRFIVTQSPMEETIGDFWRMIWQENVPYVFMLISRKESERCAQYWPRKELSGAISTQGLLIENIGVNTMCDPLFTVTSLKITGPNGEQHFLEHWQGNMNNCNNLFSPLILLKISRNCEKPVVIHDHLGISRAACLVSIEVAICSIIKGPSYAHLVQKAVQFVRSQRPFSVETPMQYIFIHRVLHAFFNEMKMEKMELDYNRWLKERTNRMFLEEMQSPIPGCRMLSPKVDPDLLRQVRRPRRQNYRREAPDCVGEWPILLNNQSSSIRTLQFNDTN